MAAAKSIILHQFEASPFAEKVRLALRLKNLAWSTVEIPRVMPKPLLMPLTGGYRRTPVLQIGADIYCDTLLILSEIERRFSDPPLIFSGHEGMQAMVSAWTNRLWFPVTARLVFGMTLDDLPGAVKKDRADMGLIPDDMDALRAEIPLMQDQWRANLIMAEARLQQTKASGMGDWMFGSHPGLIDVHCYFNIWYVVERLPEFAKQRLSETPLLQDWFDRLKKIEGQSPETISGEDAIEIAKSTAPRLVTAISGSEPQAFVPGERVRIAPDDYGKDWVTGDIVSVMPDRMTIGHVENAEANVHIHFPRVGFHVQRVENT